MADLHCTLFRTRVAWQGAAGNGTREAKVVAEDAGTPAGEDHQDLAATALPLEVANGGRLAPPGPGGHQDRTQQPGGQGPGPGGITPATPAHQHDYVQLPSGLVLQELPAIYLTERDWYARRSSSPPDSGLLSPEDLSYGDEDQFDSNVPPGSGGGQGHPHHHHHVESGIGSGADSVSAVKTRHKCIQTDPMPDEFFRIQEEEKRREEEEKRRKEEEERLQREAEERELGTSSMSSLHKWFHSEVTSKSLRSHSEVTP